MLAAFRREYVTLTGRLVSETQTAMTLALYFDLVEEQFKEDIAARLEQNIAAHKTHLTTGFMGTPYLCLVLSDNGRHDLAGKLLLQEENPGWLYEVKMGATTIWERWNSILPDGSFNPAGMNSLNHYAYGSIGKWLYSRLCQKAWNDYFLREELKAVRNAEKHYASLTRADVERIRNARRVEILQTDMKPPRLDGFEFFIVAPPDLSHTDNIEKSSANGHQASNDPVGQLTAVGHYDPETDNMEMALWSAIEPLVNKR